MILLIQLIRTLGFLLVTLAKALNLGVAVVSVVGRVL